MELTTERLLLHLLDERELSLWAENVPALEQALSITYHAEPMTGVFQEIVRGQHAILRGDPEGVLWHSFWLLLRREDRVAVGAADFKDRPDALGRVELGYGLGSDFTGHGYMTEAARGLCDFALRQPGVREVRAETERDNLPSQQVLRRCGFLPAEAGETLWWSLRGQ